MNDEKFQQALEIVKAAVKSGNVGFRTRYDRDFSGFGYDQLVLHLGAEYKYSPPAREVFIENVGTGGGGHAGPYPTQSNAHNYFDARVWDKPGFGRTKYREVIE